MAAVTDIAAGIRESHKLSHVAHLRFDECVIRLDSNSDALIEYLKGYYGNFVASDDPEPTTSIELVEGAPPEFDDEFKLHPRSPGKDKFKEEFIDYDDGRVVRKVRTGMVFLVGDSVRLAVGTCYDNRNQVVNFIDAAYLTWRLRSGALLTHSAGVCLGGDGLAISAASGAGKSTLALHLVSAGLSFVSNDRLMIRPEGDGLMMYGLPKRPRVNPGTILHNPNLGAMLTDDNRKRYESLPHEELWALEEKHDVDIERCFGAGRQALFSRMWALIVLNWRRVEKPAEMAEVSLADRPDLLADVTKSPGVFLARERLDANEASDSKYLQLFADCPVYEIHGGVDFPWAVERCRRLLEGAPTTVTKAHRA